MASSNFHKKEGRQLRALLEDRIAGGPADVALQRFSPVALRLRLSTDLL